MLDRTPEFSSSTIEGAPINITPPRPLAGKEPWFWGRRHPKPTTPTPEKPPNYATERIAATAEREGLREKVAETAINQIAEETRNAALTKAQTAGRKPTITPEQRATVEKIAARIREL